MYRRTPVTPQPRSFYSIGEDDIRVVRTMFWASLIGLGMWVLACLICSMFFGLSF